MNPNDLVIAAAGRIVDGDGSLNEVGEVRRRLEDHGSRIREYRIQPLSFGWNAPLPEGYLKGACSPLEGFILARESIEAGLADVVLISGYDPIKSAFTNRLAERDRLMRVYGERNFLSAYEELAGVFRKRFSLSLNEFENLERSLFENYWQTWTRLHPSASRPPDKWFEKVTTHFRGVDCANPNTDFEGALLVTTQERAVAAGIELSQLVSVKGVALQQACDDGVEYIEEIARYDHLKVAYEGACGEAAIDVGQLFLEGRARIEVYTCFPVVPIAFFLKTDLARDPEHLNMILKEHPVTVSGGLNLGRAPWNNTTLSTIALATQMIRGGERIIGVHSIAALGYRQGFAVLSAPTF